MKLERTTVAASMLLPKTQAAPVQPDHLEDEAGCTRKEKTLRGAHVAEISAAAAVRRPAAGSRMPSGSVKYSSGVPSLAPPRFSIRMLMYCCIGPAGPFAGTRLDAEALERFRDLVDVEVLHAEADVVDAGRPRRCRRRAGAAPPPPPVNIRNCTVGPTASVGAVGP